MQTNNYIHLTQRYNSAMALASMAVEIILPPGNGPYYFWRHGHVRHLVSLLYPNEANKPGYGQLISCSAGAKIKWLQNQSK
jgi:hypothetical protein